LLLLMLLQAVKKALKISMSASDTTTFGEFMGPLVTDIVWLWRVSVIRKVDL
jgi:hypothetical protein